MAGMDCQKETNFFGLKISMVEGLIKILIAYYFLNKEKMVKMNWQARNAMWTVYEIIRKVRLFASVKYLGGRSDMKILVW